MADTGGTPPCFGSPKPGSPCDRCDVRPECYERGAARPVFLLPRARPAPRDGTKAGATLAVEADCPQCGPTQLMRIKGETVCARCKNKLEDDP